MTKQIVYVDDVTRVVGDAGIVYDSVAGTMTTSTTINATDVTISDTLDVVGDADFGGGAVTIDGTSGDVVVADGDLTIGGTLNANNGQIAFPASQNASADANTLDDYQEGTFDFDITFGGGSTGITYDDKAGLYVKIGKLVTITGYIKLTSKGTDTGNCLISGLPFSIHNGNSGYTSVGLRVRNMTRAAGEQIQGYGTINGASIVLNTVTAAGASTTLTDANFEDDTILIVSMSYLATA